MLKPVRSLSWRWTANGKGNAKMPCLCPLPSLSLGKITLSSQTRRLSFCPLLSYDRLSAKSVRLTAPTFGEYTEFHIQAAFQFLKFSPLSCLPKMPWIVVFLGLFPPMTSNPKTGSCEHISASAKTPIQPQSSMTTSFFTLHSQRWTADLPYSEVFIFTG